MPIRNVTVRAASVCLLMVSCASARLSSEKPTQAPDEQSLSPQLKESGPESRPTLVQAAKNELPSKPKPVKGKFLDYIYMIRPDHKAEGFGIYSDNFGDGYAWGGGPYDGWFVQFFLFRGEQKDIVFEQLSGYEISEKDKIYGYSLAAYVFENKKMSRVPLGAVLPLKSIDALYERQVGAMRKRAPFNGDSGEWKFYRLIGLPKKGTIVELKVCKDEPDPPFATDTLCAQVGRLEWNKTNFVLKPSKDFPISDWKI